MKYRVGIIGCGNIAQVHARILMDMPDIEIVGCADIKKNKARDMAAMTGARAYSSAESLFNAEMPDAVHICTPHATHVPLCEAAAERRVAVFCEKPPAVTEKQWERLKAAAQLIPIGICFQNRFNPNVVRAHEILDSGEMGGLLGVRAFMTWKRDEWYYTNNWHGKWKTEGGGCLINQAIHTLDLLIGFLGKPDTVEGSMFNHHLQGKIEVEDTVEIFLKSGEKRGLLYGSCAYVYDEPVLLELRCEKGTLTIRDDLLIVNSGSESETIRCPMDPALGASYWGGGHKKCITDFYRALDEKRPCRNNPDSCADTVNAMLGLYARCRAAGMV